MNEWMNEFNTDMVLTLAYTKSSSSRLFHISNIQFIHSFFLFIYLNQATRANIKQEHKNMHEV